MPAFREDAPTGCANGCLPMLAILALTVFVAVVVWAADTLAGAS